MPLRFSSDGLHHQTLEDHQNDTSHQTSKRGLEIDLNLSLTLLGDKEQCMDTTSQNTMPPAGEDHAEGNYILLLVMTKHLQG